MIHYNINLCLRIFYRKRLNTRQHYFIVFISIQYKDYYILCVISIFYWSESDSPMWRIISNARKSIARARARDSTFSTYHNFFIVSSPTNFAIYFQSFFHSHLWRQCYRFHLVVNNKYRFKSRWINTIREL